MIQKGMDFNPFLHGGFINWDHQPGPENQIGEPLHAEIQAGPKLFVRGSFYVDDVERAKYAWNLAKATQKAGRRKLGWSVEGAVLHRLGTTILKSEVRHMALTHQPVNANSFATIAKSLTTGNTSALALENLDDRITSVLWGDCSPDRKCYDEKGKFFGGRFGMLEHLCKCRGMKPKSADGIMRRLIDSGIND